MEDLALALGFSWFVAYNRSGGRHNDFVMLPVFFTTKKDAVDFLKDYCRKPVDSTRDWVIPSNAQRYTLAFAEKLTNSLNIPQTMVSVAEMERIRPHD